MPVETNKIDQAFLYFGLEPTASLASVKEAFRRYAKEFHPDKFPQGSDAQNMATEKMIAANSYFDDLKKFFEEYPDGKPVEEGAARHEPQDDSDWEAWEAQRHTAFDDELSAWKARQSTIESEKEFTRESYRRKKLVRYCRMGLVLIIVLMWMGWFSANGRLNQKVGAQRATDQMLDGLSGNDPGNNSIHQQWQRDHAQYRENYQGKLDQQPLNGFVLLIFSAGAGWLLLSSKGKDIVSKYLENSGK